MSFASVNIPVKCTFLLVLLKCHTGQGSLSKSLLFTPLLGMFACLRIIAPFEMCSFITPANAPTCNITLQFLPRREEKAVLIPGFQKRGSRRFSLRNHNAPLNRRYFYLLRDRVTLIKAFIECLGTCGLACLSTESRNELTRGQCAFKCSMFNFY